MKEGADGKRRPEGECPGAPIEVPVGVMPVQSRQPLAAKVPGDAWGHLIFDLSCSAVIYGLRVWKSPGVDC